MYSCKQRGIALLYGVFCHAAFALGIAAMMLGLYTGLEVGRGTITGIAGGVVDGVLVFQFVVIHSFLLSARGRALLARFAPFGIGRELSTTSFAAIASLQLLLTFVAWSPIGPVWWEPHGTLRVVMSMAYAISWGMLLKAMADAASRCRPASSAGARWCVIARLATRTSRHAACSATCASRSTWLSRSRSGQARYGLRTICCWLQRGRSTASPGRR